MSTKEEEELFRATQEDIARSDRLEQMKMETVVGFPLKPDWPSTRKHC